MISFQSKPSRFSAKLVLQAVFVLTVALPTTLLFIYTVRYHEPWRDEVQALLIGRDVPPSQLIHAFRLEGVPPLYHLTLKFLCYFFSAPIALALAGSFGYATLIGGTLHLLFAVSRNAKASVAMTLLLALTNMYAYELGVISRPYGLGLGFVLAGIAEFILALRTTSTRNAFSGTLFCAFAALTSAHAACLSGAVLASFALTITILRRSIRPALPTLLALPFFALTLFLISPYPERTAEVANASNPHFNGAWQSIHDVLESGALVFGWWSNPRAFVDASGPILKLFVLAMISVIGARFLQLRQDKRSLFFVLGFVLLSWSTLLYIFIAWYTGGSRHHVFLWVPLLVASFGWTIERRPFLNLGRVLQYLAISLLIPWFVYQYRLAAEDFFGDESGPFTNTKRLAQVLPKNAYVVADHDYSVVGVQVWRDDLTLQSPDGNGRRFKHLVVDRIWHQRASLRAVLRDACTAAPDRTMFVRNSMPFTSACLQFVERGKAAVVTEASELYRVDCACYLR